MKVTSIDGFIKLETNENNIAYEKSEYSSKINFKEMCNIIIELEQRIIELEKKVI